MENNPKSPDDWNLEYIQEPRVLPEAHMDPPYFYGQFMLYRVSRNLVKEVDHWRTNKNGGNWTFFEPLLATLPVQHCDLRTKSFANQGHELKFHFNYRPCFTFDDIYVDPYYASIDGFHPVWENYMSCDFTHPKSRRRSDG